MIENTSVLDKKALVALNLNHFKRNLLPLSLIVEVLLILVTVLLSRLEDTELTDFLWVFIIVFPILMGTILALTIRKIYQSDRMVQNKTSVHFLFGEEQMDVDVKNEMTESKSMIRYSLLHHVLNTKNYLFLYQNAVTALVVDKGGFSLGDAEELLEVLHNNKVKIQKA